MKEKTYCKSPLNYIGGKYRILSQIIPLFPKEINTMVDLFAGGCDVCSNVKANKIYANDINHHIIEIYKTFQEYSIDDLLTYIDKTIEKNNLSITNKEGFISFRSKYNEDYVRNPLDLYILICYAFNHQIRFNGNHEFNTPFGLNRSSFNSNIRSNLIQFHRNIQTIEFSSKNFEDFDFSLLKKGDFLYADPPYLISTGSYNDGKRECNEWTEKDDLMLFSLLDQLDKREVKFALSNISEHKGLTNQNLIEWKKKYHTHKIECDYKNSNYHAKNTDKKTCEILITNY